jgi:serine/threonine protein kinase
MAPEALNDQAEGGIGPHTDVWALGCVIVEMLTGKMPWEGMPMQQIMMAVAMQFRVPTVPEGAPAADVLGRCFAKLPRDRPTAKQLAEAFALAAVPAPSPVLDQREHEQTLQLAQRMAEQEAITEEVTRVNSRLTQEISQLKQENVRLQREISQISQVKQKAEERQQEAERRRQELEEQLAAATMALAAEKEERQTDSDKAARELRALEQQISAGEEVMAAEPEEAAGGTYSEKDSGDTT